MEILGGERNGRCFTDFMPESFWNYCMRIKDIAIEEFTITGDTRLDRDEEKWLNVLLRKVCEEYKSLRKGQRIRQEKIHEFII